MDDLTQYILKELAVDPDNIHGTIIPREMLLSDSVYNKIRPKIPELKKKFSTSYMTCLHENAGKTQKWPMLNLVRQLLSTYHYQMKPIRKSDGYTKDGVKKYKRFFMVSRLQKGMSPRNANSDHDASHEEESAELVMT